MPVARVSALLWAELLEGQTYAFFEERDKLPLGFRVIGFQGTLAPRIAYLKLIEDSQ